MKTANLKRLQSLILYILKDVEIINRNLKTREMKKDDIEACARLFYKVFTKGPWFDNWQSTMEAEKYLTELMNNPVFIGIIIEKDNKIVGASFGHTRSWYEGEEYCIDEFYIDNEIQGIGLGSKFMEEIKKNMILRDIHCIFLLTERGIPAETFYKKNSFKSKDSSLFMYSIF